jgi:hypothetical protein
VGKGFRDSVKEPEKRKEVGLIRHLQEIANHPEWAFNLENLHQASQQRALS